MDDGGIHCIQSPFIISFFHSWRMSLHCGQNLGNVQIAQNFPNKIYHLQEGSLSRDKRRSWVSSFHVTRKSCVCSYKQMLLMIVLLTSSGPPGFLNDPILPQAASQAMHRLPIAHVSWLGWGVVSAPTSSSCSNDILLNMSAYKCLEMKLGLVLLQI